MTFAFMMDSFIATDAHISGGEGKTGIIQRSATNKELCAILDSAAGGQSIIIISYKSVKFLISLWILLPAALRLITDAGKGDSSGAVEHHLTAVPCGSPSITRTFFPNCEKPPAIWIDVVVLPAPLFD
jgi:hypothetical protein